MIKNELSYQSVVYPLMIYEYNEVYRKLLSFL